MQKIEQCARTVNSSHGPAQLIEFLPLHQTAPTREDLAKPVPDLCPAFSYTYQWPMGDKVSYGLLKLLPDNGQVQTGFGTHISQLQRRETA